MLRGAPFAIAAAGVGVITLIHAIIVWPIHAVVVFFVGGAFIAFTFEWIAIRSGVLDHHTGPYIDGVPIYLLAAWPGTIYIAFQISLLFTESWAVIVLSALIATFYDIATDHYGIEAGNWTYSNSIPGPTFRGVPWWNFGAWFVISALTVLIAYPVIP